VSPDPGLTRRRYIDWARALAIIVMIEAHTIDAWTRWPDKTGRPYAYATVLGGFAAPLFLWLAGIGVAFSAAGLLRRAHSRGEVVEVVARRGLEIFILAFLFRLQAFVVSPGSYLVSLFRVDILNVMGPAVVAAGLVWGMTRRRPLQVAAYSGLAVTFAMLTPLVRASEGVDWLPLWLQWYVRPAGDYTTFTLFPWAGFVFAGAACGVVLAGARDERTEQVAHAALAIVGAAVTAVGFITAARPSIYVQSSFWSSSPTYFAIRAGVLMMGLALLKAAVPALEARGLRWRAIDRLGRSSLFVYWIHVELVYGYATWPIRQRLPLWGSGLAFILFTVLMYQAVRLRDRLVQAWREPRPYGTGDLPAGSRAG
jgi:uncharacterized membrane protein